MRVLTTYLLLLFSIVCFGQNKEKVTVNEIVIGKNLLTDQDIKAKEYVFSEKIFDAYIDSLSRRFTVQLRGTSRNGKWMNPSGDLVMYDPTALKVLWSRKIAYDNKEVDQFGDFIIHTTLGKSRSIDPNTGEKLWDLKNTILYANSQQRIALGYKFNNWEGSLSENLEAIDLDNGAVKWVRKVPYGFGWSRTYNIADTAVLIVSDGIHWLNLKNGSGWDYSLKTYGLSANGAPAGRDLVSNIVRNSDRMYIAGKDKLVCLNLKGKELWSQELSPKFQSTSDLISGDSTLYLINTGLAGSSGYQTYHGIPYIAAFDQRTGKEVFFQDFSYRKNPIKDFELDTDNIYLLFNDRIVRYTVSTNKVTEKVFKTDSIGKLHFFIGGSAYLPANKPAEGSYQSLRYSDMTRQYFYTDKEKVYILDDMNIISNADVKNFHTLYLTSKKHQFISKNGETTVLDNYGRSIAQLKMSKQSFLIGETLYDIQNDRIVEINLEDLHID